MKKAIIMTLMFATSCADKEEHLQGDGQLLQKMRVALGPVRTMTRGYKKLKLDSLTTFAWDSVFFFNGEEGERYISEVIGFSWQGPEVPNAHKRLLFVRQHKVILFVDINEAGPIDTASKKWPLPIFMYPRPGTRKLNAAYSKSESHFAAFRSCNNRSPFIALVPMKFIANFQEEINTGCPL